MIESLYLKLVNLLFDKTGKAKDFDFGENLAVSAIMFVGLLIVAAFIYILVRRVIVGVFNKLVKITANDWDDELMNSRIFRWLSLLAPILVLWHGAPKVFHAPELETVGDVIRVVCEVLTVVMVLLSINSLLNVIERIYRRYEMSRELPVKSFFQVVKIVLTLIGVIFIISTVAGKSPVLIFSGLGAMTAVLMLIFKDSILGLVAGIQLSANRMVARGDWIEMPKFGADGEVLEVALTTVKVKNWDKTITTVPTYALISDSFKNWRGMSKSGVRRIKRSIHIDMNTVKFLDAEMLEKMRHVSLLEDYLKEKEADIAAWNTERGVDASDLINARAMTNVGTFRAYVNEYLKNHPKISNKETLLVRQLQPSENGLPIEVYVFSSDNRWIEYEGIQSDIFDHLMAVMREFGLGVYQNPSGANLEQLAEAIVQKNVSN